MLKYTLVMLVLLFAAPSWAQDCDPLLVGPLSFDDPCFMRDPPISREMCEDFLNDSGWVEGDSAMAINEPTASWEAIDHLQGICVNNENLGCTDVQCRCTCLQPPALICGKIGCVCVAQGRLAPAIPEECGHRP